MFHLTTCIIVLLTAIKCNHDIQLYPRATTSIICLCICNEGNFISHTKSIKNRPLRPCCTTIILMMLMMCGDVESNPGPITMDHCGTCRKVVKTGEKALGCEYCNTWFHTECEKYKPLFALRLDGTASLLKMCDLTFHAIAVDAAGVDCGCLLVSCVMA